MANTPQYTAIPRLVVVQLGAANPALDGTGSFGAETFVAGANGSRLDKAVVKALVSTTAGMVRIFTSTGAAKRLLTEIPVQAVAKSASVASFEVIVDFLGGLPIPAGCTLYASTEKGEAIVVSMFGGDY